MTGRDRSLALVMSFVVACSARSNPNTNVNPDDAGFAADGFADDDAPVTTDVPVGTDAPVGVDVQTLADVPVATDAPVTTVDVPAPVDAPVVTVDVPTAMDAGVTLTASQQIAAVRATPVGTAALRVDGAVVTYVVAATLRTDGTVSPTDPAGFFVQAERTGPALFVAVDPATLSPAPTPGDRVGFTVTRISSPTPATHWAAEIGGYGRTASGVPLSPLLQDVTNAGDLVTNLLGYEDELITMVATVTSDFSAGGTGFLQASIATAALPADPLLKLRVPYDTITAAGLRNGCRFSINATPMWRFDMTAQAALWTARDVSSVSCPPPPPVDAGTPDVPRDSGTVSFDAGPFTGDDTLWVVRVGDGVTPLSGAAVPVTIESYNGTSGAAGTTIALPTTAAGANQMLTLAGTAAAEGSIARSANGAWATIGGYNFPVGTATPNTAPGPRVVARISPSGVVDTSTNLATAADHSAIRAVVSTTGSEFWSIHSNGSDGDVVYSGYQGSVAPVSTTNRVVFRGLTLFGSQLLASGDNPTGSGISATTTLPRAAGNTITLLPGFPPNNTLSPYGVAAFDRDGNGAPDVMFIGDDRAVLLGGGVQCWALSAGTWSLVASIANVPSPIRSLVGHTNGADYVLYGVTSEGRARLLRFDVSSATLSATVTPLAQAPLGTTYRGLTFAPR